MHLMDTAGQEDYAELRVLGHANTNCFIVSFSVADKVDFLKDLNFRSGIQTKMIWIC
jgi:GTPase SAR1 family protein